MNSTICTLFEGDYHYGVGALVNSLYKHGFRGVVWAGYRGALPPWAKDVQQCPQYQEFTVAEGCCVRFVPVNTARHLTNYKPDFMVDLWEEYCSLSEALFYFDPDIVIKCRWSFFEEWALCGVAICGDGHYYQIPSDHPMRCIWKEYAFRKGYGCQKETNNYYNGGFVGFHHTHKSALRIWQKLLAGLIDEGVDLNQFMPGDRTLPFFATDQDMLNLMAMVTPDSLSTIGPSGMDFDGTGNIMSHAFGVKPWRKQFARTALHGFAPSSADKGFVANSLTPINLYSQRQRIQIGLDLRCGAAIGRLIRKN